MNVSELKIMIIAVIGIIISYIDINGVNETVLLGLRYVALLFPVAYTAWKWRKDVKKDRKDKK